MNNKLKSGLCIGLDFKGNLEDYINFINLTNAEIYKFNPAFNPQITLELSEYLHTNNITWIYDAKLGDVHHTNKEYAKYVFETLKADAVTLNPYVGFDALQPFFEYKDKTSFVLCKTTNKGSDFLQNVCYKKIIKHIKNKENLGIVFAGNKEEELINISKELKNNLILSPGIGAQGGKVIDKNNNIIYSVSRSIINSLSPRKSADIYRYKIDNDFLFSKIEKYIKKGKFLLSSGIESNFYVDLKSLSGDIELFDFITDLLAENIQSDAILGIASGSISYATAVALKTNKPFGYIRLKNKEYGTSKNIEGLNNKKIKSITIIEDVLTTGKSVKKAIQIAESHGFVVDKVICVVDRSSLNKNIKNVESLLRLYS